jgi:hypothetical protein
MRANEAAQRSKFIDPCLTCLYLDEQSGAVETHRPYAGADVDALIRSGRTDRDVQSLSTEDSSYECGQLVPCESLADGLANLLAGYFFYVRRFAHILVLFLSACSSGPFLAFECCQDALLSKISSDLAERQESAERVEKVLIECVSWNVGS